MSHAAQLPTWAVYAVAFGTPASAFLGVMLTGLLGRRSAAELERRSQREEVMRLMRWSSELAMEPDDRRAQLGVDQLSTLAVSELLGAVEKAFVDVALESALADVANSMTHAKDAENEWQIREHGGTPPSDPPNGNPPLPLIATTDEGAADG